MNGDEYHPRIPSPRFMKMTADSHLVASGEGAKTVSKSHGRNSALDGTNAGGGAATETKPQKIIRPAASEDASAATGTTEPQNASADTRQPDDLCREQKADMRFVRSDREGDPCISPNPGTPRLMQGEVKLRVDLVSSDAQPREEGTIDGDGDVPKAPCIGFLPFLGWAFCLIVVLWMIATSSPFLANALTLRGWRLCASLFLGLLPSMFVLGVMLYAVIRFRSIPRMEQFSEVSFIDNIDELKERLAIQYLRGFSDPQRYAIENGFVDKSNVTDDVPIVDCLKRLKGEIPSSCSGSDGWLYLFKEFQRMQDERAKEIIGKTWKLVAIKTAASPWKIVDMIAVFYNSTVMIARLAKLYNRRMSSQAAFRLACGWFINIYIAGGAGDAAQGAVEWASANDLISATFKPLAGIVGKVAEGGANAFLVQRLGRRAMEYLRPMR